MTYETILSKTITKKFERCHSDTLFRFFVLQDFSFLLFLNKRKISLQQILYYRANLLQELLTYKSLLGRGGGGRLHDSCLSERGGIGLILMYRKGLNKISVKCWKVLRSDCNFITTTIPHCRRIMNHEIFQYIKNYSASHLVANY